MKLFDKVTGAYFHGPFSSCVIVVCSCSPQVFLLSLAMQDRAAFLRLESDGKSEPFSASCYVKDEFYPLSC